MFPSHLVPAQMDHWYFAVLSVCMCVVCVSVHVYLCMLILFDSDRSRSCSFSYLFLWLSWLSLSHVRFVRFAVASILIHFFCCLTVRVGCLWRRHRLQRAFARANNHHVVINNEEIDENDAGLTENELHSAIEMVSMSSSASQLLDALPQTCPICLEPLSTETAKPTITNHSELSVAANANDPVAENAANGDSDVVGEPPRGITGSLACNHSFHATCIRKWLLVRGTCPVCRHSCHCVWSMLKFRFLIGKHVVVVDLGAGSFNEASVSPRQTSVPTKQGPQQFKQNDHRSNFI